MDEITTPFTKYSIQNLCRTCTADIKIDGRSEIAAMNIFERLSEASNSPTVMKLLTAIEPQIKITFQDNLPKMVCSRCIKQLIKIHKFMITYKEANKKLLSLCDNIEKFDESDYEEVLQSRLQESKDEGPRNITPNINGHQKDTDEKSETSIDWTNGDNSNNDLNTIIDNLLDSSLDNLDKISCTEMVTSKDQDENSDKLTDEEEVNDVNNSNNLKIRTQNLMEYIEEDVEPKNIFDSTDNLDSVQKNTSRNKNELSTKQAKQKGKKPPGRKKKDYECKFCGKVFIKSRSYREHQVTHRDDRPFLCSDCGKGFKAIRNLRAHMLRHKGERTVQCPICPKKFVCRSGLYSHMMVHNKVKPFVCDICGSAFHRATMLRQHSLFHQDVKNFACDECDMSFVTASRLKRHMRKHTGEKPYTCCYCERPFAQSTQCITHMKIHVGENVHQCELCPLRFPLVRDLRNHIVTHKNDDEETRKRHLEARAIEINNLKTNYGLKKELKNYTKVLDRFLFSDLPELLSNANTYICTMICMYVCIKQLKFVYKIKLFISEDLFSVNKKKRFIFEMNEKSENSSSSILSLCRTCTKNTTAGADGEGAFEVSVKCIYEPLLDNVGSGSSNPTIMELLAALEPQIKIAFLDKLPKIVCMECIEELQAINKFMESYRQANKRLQKLLNGIGNSLENNEQGPKENVINDETEISLPVIHESDHDDMDTTTIIEKREYQISEEVVDIGWTNDHDEQDGNSSDEGNNLLVEDPLQSEGQRKKRCRITKEPMNSEELNENNVVEDEKHNSDSFLQPRKRRRNKRTSNALEPKTAEDPKELNVVNAAESESQMNEDQKVNANCSSSNEQSREAEPLPSKLKRQTRRTIEPKTADDSKELNMVNAAESEIQMNEDEKINSNCSSSNEQSMEAEPPRRKKKRKVSKIIKDIEKLNVDDVVEKLPEMNDNGKFTCWICNKDLDTLDMWRQHFKALHISKVTGQPKKWHECKFCKKVYTHLAAYNNHVRTHTGEEPYLCGECGKSFKSPSCLYNHTLRHKGDKTRQCPHCPKTFVCTSDLSVHMYVHKKEKPFVCETCGAAFHFAYMLRKHNLYHQGIKKYRCEYCDLSFVTADGQRCHMRTHTGEKPYACRYCDRAFAQNYDCNKHMRQHVGDNIYQCDLCPLQFPMARDLRVHYATHKNDDEETRKRNLEEREISIRNLKLKFSSKKE
ncbi:uncharacterized protein [Musca autumnalis]|uniref:uncharacterized protein n=1 Tax=Musca autumnalis TaxID=221902 RepID=UPI003CF9623B